MNAVTTANPAIVVTEAVTVQLASYVSRFKIYANKSAENILEMAKVVFEASNVFKKDPFSDFCKAVGLTDTGTISKMKMIGKRYESLSPYKDRLPSAWTTLYTIAKATDDEFAAAIEGNKLSAFTKSSDIAEIFPRLQRVRKEIAVAANESANDDSEYKLTIRISSMPSAAAAAGIDQAVRDLLKTFGVDGQVIRSESIEMLLEDDTAAMVAAA